jgi:dTDP-4-dehydrorhamnose reductase
MKTLILGDGLLGSELHELTKWDLASRKLSNLDIDNLSKLKDLVSGYNNIVNCIANTDSYSDDKDKHLNTNFRFAVNLSNICNNLNIKLIHISTEFVYANNIQPPTEEDLPLPDKSWYAYSKLLADEYISLTNNNFLICRLLHKPNPFPYDDVWDVITSGDTVDKISFLIVQLIKEGATGIFNVGTGRKKLSNIAPGKKVVPKPNHVPFDTSMNLSKLNLFLNNENNL